VCAMQQARDECDENKYEERVMNAMKGCGVIGGERVCNDER
jgi:hypothetical protein